MKVRVYGKLNLALAVTGKRGNYHDLSSIMQSVDLFDAVTVEKSDTVAVQRLSGVPDEKNTAFLAAKEFCRRYGGGCDVTIEKHIPFGAGMGGSSADAAAVLYCLCKLYGEDIGEVSRAVAPAIGSDVAYMMRGGLAKISGRGTVEKFYDSPETYFALTFFKPVSTAEVFADYDRLGTDERCDVAAVLQKYLSGDAEGAAAISANALRLASTRRGYADSYYEFCKARGFKTLMTGSGSAHFIVFSDRAKAEAAANSLSAAGLFSIVVKSMPCGIVFSD